MTISNQSVQVNKYRHYTLIVTNEKERWSKFRSIANMCKAEFYPHRAAIDYVVSQQEIPYGDETLVTIGLGSGGTRVVQVEDADVVRTYEVFAI